jgi:GDPmannose 4,6-dehydratase
VRTALITGIAGQDGSYLAEFLLGKGYAVHGIVRPGREQPPPRVAHLHDQVTLHAADLGDVDALTAALGLVRPGEVYNLAAQSSVGLSWQQPLITVQANAVSVTCLLEAIRRVDPTIRFFQASSTEMFGRMKHSGRREPMLAGPCNPYGAAKLFGHYITVNYRESFGLFACSGILSSHESPRRGVEFVTRKITDAVARIHYGLASELRLGNLHARRDWGFAGDFVEAMWLTLQQSEADDYLIATGQYHTVEEFVTAAFGRVGLDWQNYVVVDPALVRPAETGLLPVDGSKAMRQLGWFPRVGFRELVAMMVDADVRAHERDDPGPVFRAA